MANFNWHLVEKAQRGEKFVESLIARKDNRWIVRYCHTKPQLELFGDGRSFVADQEFTIYSRAINSARLFVSKGRTLKSD